MEISMSYWKSRKKMVVHNNHIISCSLSEMYLMIADLLICGTPDLSSLGMVGSMANGFEGLWWKFFGALEA